VNNKMMNLKDIVISLDAAEVQRILTIELDSNKDDALEFIRNVLLKKIRKALESHCVPVFEANYRPHQMDEYIKKE